MLGSTLGLHKAVLCAVFCANLSSALPKPESTEPAPTPTGSDSAPTAPTANPMPDTKGLSPRCYDTASADVRKRPKCDQGPCGFVPPGIQTGVESSKCEEGECHVTCKKGWREWEGYPGHCASSGIGPYVTKPDIVYYDFCCGDATLNGEGLCTCENGLAPGGNRCSMPPA